MKMSHAIVRVSKIESPQMPSDFDEIQLEKAAQLILKMGATVNPIILQRTEPEAESYTIVDGHFEYYAALKAIEMDPRKGKMINAYIVESEAEKSDYEAQIEVFRRQASVNVEPPVTVDTGSQTNNEAVVSETTDNVQLINLLKGLSNQIVEMKSLQSKQATQMAEMNKQQSQQHDAVNKRLESLQKVMISNPPTPTPIPKPTPPPPPSPPPSSDFLTAINNPELADHELEKRLKAAGVSEKVRERIISERQQKPFTSLKNLINRTKGLAETGLINILDKWT